MKTVSEPSAGGPAAQSPSAIGWSGSGTTPAAPQFVAFHRTELAKILSVYGRMVAQGEWRDYAIDHLKDAAIFSIFRRTSEMPLLRIEKRPKLARRQGAFQIVGPSGLILKRGHELDQVLRYFDRKRFRLLE